MGCMLSKRNAGRPFGFKVFNLDCNGNVKNEGHLEITSSNLVLRFKGNKSLAVWPLSSVRKYGYEDFMFCFEAGRSSPCGQGVFAFKSKKAKQIFDTIKEELSKVDNNIKNNEDISLEIREYSNQASSSTNNIFENHGEIQFSSLKYSESNEYIHTPHLIEPDLIEPDLLEPENVLISQVSSLVDTMNNKKLINAGIFASDYYQLPAEVLQYTEVEIAVCPVRRTDPLPIIPPECPESSDYSVIDSVHIKKTDPLPIILPKRPEPSDYSIINFLHDKKSDPLPMTPPEHPEPLNYSVIDFVQGEKTDPLPTIPSERLEPSDYNVIDFVQTMNVSKKMFKSTGDIGERKTRHDFSLEDV